MAVCVGCGLDVNPDSGLLEVQVDPAGGIACHDAGLYLTGGGAYPGVSPDDCNALVLHGNGLYVPCSDGVAGTSSVQTSPQGSGLPQAVVNGGSYGYLNDNTTNSIHICNPTCCTVSGVVTVAVGDVYLDGPAGFIGGAHLQVNINNGGMNDVSPSTRQTLSADAGNSQDMFLDINQNASFFLTLGATACADYQFNLLFNINTAAGGHIRTDSTGPKFVTRWILTHTDCCDHHN